MKDYVVQMEPATGCTFNCMFLCFFNTLEEAAIFFDKIQDDHNEPGDSFMITLSRVNNETDRFDMLANPKTITGEKAFLLTVLLFFRHGEAVQVKHLNVPDQAATLIAEWLGQLPANY